MTYKTKHSKLIKLTSESKIEKHYIIIIELAIKLFIPSVDYLMLCNTSLFFIRKLIKHHPFNMNPTTLSPPPAL